MNVTTIKRGFYTIVRGTKKYSPEILIALGLTGAGVTVALVYKARPKVEKIIEKVEDMREVDPEVEINKVEVAKDLAKALALPIVVGTLSTLAIVSSYRIQHNRITTLAGLFAVAQTTQKAFEDKFKEKFGEAAYNEFVAIEEVHTPDVDEEGETIDTIEKIKTDMDGSVGEWYDKSEFYVSDDNSYNLAYIDSVVSGLDLKLFGKGYILLNEVREKLGFPRTRAGALLGWSSADYFNVDKIMTNMETPLTGEMKTQIFLKWSQPHYIYDNIEYSPTFDTW